MPAIKGLRDCLSIIRWMQKITNAGCPNISRTKLQIHHLIFPEQEHHPFVTSSPLLTEPKYNVPSHRRNQRMILRRHSHTSHRRFVIYIVCTMWILCVVYMSEFTCNPWSMTVPGNTCCPACADWNVVMHQPDGTLLYVFEYHAKFCCHTYGEVLGLLGSDGTGLICKKDALYCA
jgi:hypothetical protein